MRNNNLEIWIAGSSSPPLTCPSYDLSFKDFSRNFQGLEQKFKDVLGKN